jgi:hypothetical protein
LPLRSSITPGSLKVTSTLVAKLEYYDIQETE